jgi:hypothetical protein
MANEHGRQRNEKRTPSPDEIAARAYELFQTRGGEGGHALADWLEAERELSHTSAGETNERRRTPQRDLES